MNEPVKAMDLSKTFRKSEALHNLNLSVQEGSVYGLIGPNGAGKTTTLKILMNILSASGGRAEVLGVDSRTLGSRQLAEIGYVSENQRLYDWMRCGELVRFTASGLVSERLSCDCNRLWRRTDTNIKLGRNIHAHAITGNDRVFLCARNLYAHSAHINADGVVQDGNNESAAVHHHFLTAKTRSDKGDFFGCALVEPPENDPKDHDRHDHGDDDADNCA